ncbi:MAG: stage III sporulation protein AD [Bacillota bacterium]
MEIFNIVILGLVVTILIVIVRQHRPEYALQLSIMTGVIILAMMLGKINSIVTVMKQLANRANINLLYMETVMKIIGIAYIAEFGAQICRDAGEGAVAGKIEFAAKVIVMVLAIPILVAVFDTLLKIMP